MTNDAIIEAAEKLFARYGIDGVSMRQISQAAGSGNHYSVQYHFGNKTALAEAIVARHAPDMERRRGDLMAEVAAAGRLKDPVALLRALVLPYIDLVDENGDHAYAAFAIHLYWQSSISTTWLTMPDFAPLARHIIHLLRDCVDLPADVANFRLRIAVVSFLHVVVETDRERRAGTLARPLAEYWDDAIAAAAAAFAHPWSGGAGHGANAEMAVISRL